MAELQRATYCKPGRPTVAEAALERLRRSCYRQLRQVTCHFHEGVLILHGQLPSYYLKQHAQEAVMDLKGVEEIINRIDVEW